MNRELVLRLLEHLHKELSDNKWKTWPYTEGVQMYEDLDSHVAALSIIIEEVKKS
jgi:hypothetical protein